MLLLTLLFVSTVVASPLLGTEQCARGSQYWCTNVRTASQCGAVTHCQQNVWNKPQMKSIPCDICKEVVTAVAEILKQNSTEAEILGYLEKICQFVPEEGLAAECKQLVDEYFPIVMAILIGELDNPCVVCGAIALCKSEQVAVAQLEAQEQLLSNEIPKLDLSKQLTPFMVNVPQLLYPQESPKQEAPKAEHPKQGEDDVCLDCIKFLSDTQLKVKTNSSFASALIENIENQCDLLGPGMSSMCKEYVSQYGTFVIEQLLSMDPKDLCAHAGFCPAVKSSRMLKLLPAKTVPADKSVPILKLVPASKVESAAVKPAQPLVRVRESNLCSICELVIKELETVLKDHTTEEEIIHAVENVCQFLPSKLRGQCKDLIETYGKAIVELLVEQADPQTVCTLLALCNDASRTFVPALNQMRFKVGDYCNVCKMAVRYVDEILEKNATQAQIEEAVRKACSFLPESVRTECDQLVQQYEPMMVQLLLQMLDPDFVCMKLEACPGATLLGRELCTRGPEFWCRNMETANLCDAESHCRRHVWA